MKKVFIIGAHRSGTTKLASYFSDILGFAGDFESHVFRLVSSLMDGKGQIEKSIPKGAYDVNKIGFDKILGALVGTLEDLVINHHEGRDFFDKTPGSQMINATKLIAKYIPDAKFIYMQRNGIANVKSNLRLWPSRSFAHACTMWAYSIDSFTNVRDLLGDRLLFIEMNEMIHDPWKMHQDIISHLELPGRWSEEEIKQYFDSPSMSSTNAAAPKIEAPLLSEQDWSDEDKATFERLCGDAMRRMGYEY